MSDIYDEIREERIRQDEKWGGPEHDDRHAAEDWKGFIFQRLRRQDAVYRDSFIEIAALAVAAIESNDRMESE